MPSVVQDWVQHLPLKQQTVLLCALRGCDGIAKEDPSKKFVRHYRNTLLLNADAHSDFMKGMPTESDVRDFCKALDGYPMHWLLHFLHGCEIVGYKHPHFPVRVWWHKFYDSVVENGLHLRHETEEALDRRLSDEI